MALTNSYFYFLAHEILMNFSLSLITFTSKAVRWRHFHGMSFARLLLHIFYCEFIAFYLYLNTYCCYSGKEKTEVYEQLGFRICAGLVSLSDIFEIWMASQESSKLKCSSPKGHLLGASFQFRFVVFSFRKFE